MVFLLALACSIPSAELSAEQWPGSELDPLPVAPSELSLELDSALVPGTTVRFTVGGLSAGKTVGMTGSAAGVGAGICPPVLGGLCLDLRSPLILGVETTTATTHTFDVAIPPELPLGMLLSFQAAMVDGPDSASSIVVSARTVGAGPAPVVDQKVIAYFTEWGVYARDYQVADIPVGAVSHINYAFADVTLDGLCAVVDPWAAYYVGDAGVAPDLAALAAANPPLKILLSVGGWTLSANFSAAAATPDGRAALASSCLDLVDSFGFHGLDIDWEYPVEGGLYPGMPEDTVNYTLLMEAIRAEMDARGGDYLLTMAAPAGADHIGNLEPAGLAAHVDWINVMSYDFHGAWDLSATHLHNPLAPGSDFPAGPDDPNTASGAIQTYIDMGVPPEQLVLGVPMYGRSYGGVGATGDGLFQPAGFAGPGTWESGVVDHWDMQATYLTRPDCTRHWHTEASVPWVYCTDGTFITYEDTTSLAAKLDWVTSMGLGGVMTWEFAGDDADHSMIWQMSDAMLP